MICSGSSSSRRAALAAILLAGSLAACRHGRPEGPPPLRLAVFPVQNASGGTAPIKPLTENLDAELASRGLEVVPRRELDLVLARHRIRFTGGVDRPLAKVLREELFVDAMLVPTLELYTADVPPRVAMTARLVSTAERPTVLWSDSVARAGDDAPGLLSRGIVNDVGVLQKRVVASVAESVKRYVDKQEPGESCGEVGKFKPRRVFRAPVLDDVGRRSIAVLPFVNETSRRAASDVILNQFVSQLARSGSFEVLDPGVVREELLGHRIVLEGGVSVDQAMSVLDELDADLVLSGYVQIYESRSGKQGPPKVEFNAFVLDRETGEQVWASTSTGEGDDRVWFFGAGYVHTASALSCRMVRGVVDGIVGKRGPVTAAE